MSHLSAEVKHAILLEYTPRSATHSFAALAARHAVEGGADVVRHWHDRWDGTLQSLEEKQRAGRPRALSSEQVEEYIRAPIAAANAVHRAVHYPTVAAEAREATGVEVSLRTVQRYGKEELGAKKGKGKKRTADEREYTHARESGRCVALRVHQAERVGDMIPRSAQVWMVCSRGLLNKEIVVFGADLTSPWPYAAARTRLCPWASLPRTKVPWTMGGPPLQISANTR